MSHLKALSKAVTPSKIGKIINEFMNGKSPKRIAFDNNVSRDDVYCLRREYPLFCGWTNEYNRE